MSAEEAPSCSRTEEKWRNLVNDELVERQVLLPDRTKNLLDSDRGGTFVLTRQGEGFHAFRERFGEIRFGVPGSCRRSNQGVLLISMNLYGN
jgi:hypothetical protein